MAKIETLITDIYKMLEDGVDTSSMKNRDSMEKFSKSIWSAMARQLKEGTRQREAGGGLRMSQIGKPDRQLWYTYRGITEPRPIDGQTN